MLTLGIDLASADDRTAACEVDWRRSSAEVTRIEVGVADDRLLTLIRGAQKVGIDVPLGWPDMFVSFIQAHHQGRPLPAFDRRAGRLRETDRFVHAKTGRWPLSVAADRIAMPAMRAAVLLARLADRDEPVDRTGMGRLAEVYPAAALTVWGRVGNFTSRGYKGSAGRAARRKVLAALARGTSPGLRLSVGVQRACYASDDALDALVAALVARAAALDLCEPIPSDTLDRARREGWIALPQAGSLARLSGRSEQS